MKATGRIHDARASGMRAGELDYSFDSLASRTAKEGPGEPPAGAVAQPRGEFSRQFRDMALQHRRTVAVELVLERGNHSGMIVADVVNAVAGNEIQDAPPAGGVELSANAARVIDVHPQNIEQPHPLRIHVSFVKHLLVRGAFCFWHRTYPRGTRPHTSVLLTHQRRTETSVGRRSATVGNKISNYDTSERRRR